MSIIMYIALMGKNDTCSWDDPKRETNITKHGFDFVSIHEVFDGRLTVTREDNRRDYGEKRYNMLTEFHGFIINVTFTPRAGRAHLISVRPANRAERKVYDAKRKSL